MRAGKDRSHRDTHIIWNGEFVRGGLSRGIQTCLETEKKREKFRGRRWDGGVAAQTDRSSQASICCRLHGYLEDGLKQAGKGRASCEVTATLPAAPHLPVFPLLGHPNFSPPCPPPPRDVTTGSSFRSGQSQSSTLSLRGLHSGARLLCPLHYQLQRATLPPSSSSSPPRPRQGSATPAGAGAARLLTSQIGPSACAKWIFNVFTSFFPPPPPLPSSLPATWSGGSLKTSPQGFVRGKAAWGHTGGRGG